jgi:hypothetical protein
MKTKKDSKQAIVDLRIQAADVSLKPLMATDARVMLQLFILEIEYSPKNKATEISYGWCLVSPRRDIFNKATYSSPFKLWNEKGIKSSISKVSIYTTSQVALNIVAHLISGWRDGMCVEAYLALDFFRSFCIKAKRTKEK